MGRRHCLRRWAKPRSAALLRRPVHRLPVLQGRPRAQNARSPRRHDDRRRRPPRFRADHAGPRAAHPARKGDVKHLHRARHHVPLDWRIPLAHGAERTARSRRALLCRRTHPARPAHGRRSLCRSIPQPAVLQRVHPQMRRRLSRTAPPCHGQERLAGRHRGRGAQGFAYPLRHRKAQPRGNRGIRQRTYRV